jgi:hypothetical protein
MEDQTIMVYISMILSVGGAVLAVINHKRIRSNCCGKRAELSFDIENTTPRETVKSEPELVK